MTAQGQDPNSATEHALLRELLDAEAGALDAATLSRLNRARQAALDAGLQSRVRRWQAWVLALPAAALTVLALWLLPLQTPIVESEPELAELEALLTEPLAADGELLASDAPLELIDDWEFYAWLEQQPYAGRG